MSPSFAAIGTENARVYAVGTLVELDDVRHALLEHDGVELLGWSETAAEAAATLGAWDVDAVLVAAPAGTVPTADLTEIRTRTSAPVVLAAPADDPPPVRDALAAGVADVVLLPQPVQSIVFALRKAAARHADAPTGGRGTVVTVFSPKGGSGKSVLAVNLAAALATVEAKRTLLVDLDLQFGNAAVMLGLEPDRTINDLVSAPGDLDAEKVAGFALRHSSGIDLVAAPPRPEDAELVGVGRIARLFEVARESYDVVVVDTASFLHGPVLTAFDHTDELLVLATLDVPTLKDVAQTLQTLELVSFPATRVSLVLNRATAKVGLNAAEVEAALGRRFRFALPEDREVAVAVNTSVPIVLARPKAKFSRAVRDAARALSDVPPRARPDAVAAEVVHA